jgi:hypothetical protein
MSFLRWRYVRAPNLTYHVVCDEDGGRLQGIAIFRVRQRGTLSEAAVTDVITRADWSASHRTLLRKVIHACDVDHVTCLFPEGSPSSRAARSLGFLRAPTGIDVIANPLSPNMKPDPTSMRSWAFCLGDLEVF